MKKCGYCGADVADEEVICPGCGKALDAGYVENPFEHSSTVNKQDTNAGNADAAPAGNESWVEEKKTAAPADQNLNGERGEGYWQYGQWHPIDELNNPAANQDPGAQGGWNQSGQNPWGQNPNQAAQQPWGGQAPNGAPGYGPNAQYNMNQGNMNGWNPNAYGQAPYMQPKPQMCGEAVASLVLAIASVFLNSFLMIPSILAVVFGIVALVKIRKNPGRYGGKGLAIAGIIVGVLFFLLFLFAYILLFKMMSNPELWRAFEEYVKQLEQI
uniref:DUF4190 domain-containing protein n=1 Tax=Eubacterium cellulosolvens TaxID=29322 RepID=UPI000687A36A|nr:DUF4190 domain-containing protein [[Eubacterium] cellulosolvens]